MDGEDEVTGKQDTHYSNSCDEPLSFKERKHILMAVGAYKVRVEFPGSKSRGHRENLRPTSTHDQPKRKIQKSPEQVLLHSFKTVQPSKLSLKGPQTRGFPVGGARPLSYSEVSSAPHLDSRKPGWDYEKAGIMSSAVFCKTRLGGLGDRPPGDPLKEPRSRKQEARAIGHLGILMCDIRLAIARHCWPFQSRNKIRMIFLSQSSFKRLL